MVKFDKTYKTIGEVAKILNLVNKKTGKLSTYTIRFWEKEFNEIKPRILAGNRRYYDKNSIEFIKKVHFLLKDKGMTINGAKKFLDDENSLNLDETLNHSIKASEIKNRLSKISGIIKSLKK